MSVQTADNRFSAPGLDRRSALYRAVNERIREVNAAFAVFTDNYDVYCECGAPNCLERVEVPANVYEDVLSGPRSLVKAGHESPGHGVVVAESASYVVIEADDRKPAARPRRAADADDCVRGDGFDRLS